MKTREYHKLKQLDRIEYKLNFNDYNNSRYKIYNLIADLRLYIEIYMFVLISLMFFYILTNNVNPELTGLLLLMGKLFKPYILILIIGYIISFVIFILNIKKLDKRFRPDSENGNKQNI